jgi:hypothetical protein
LSRWRLFFSPEKMSALSITLSKEQQTRTFQKIERGLFEYIVSPHAQALPKSRSVYRSTESAIARRKQTRVLTNGIAA